MMKEAMHSMKLLLSKTEIAVMRATSTQVMQSLQSLTEIITLCLLGMIIFDFGITTDSVLFTEIMLRLFSLYVLQIAARWYVFYRVKN
jgi:tellurite resistance protein TehA-like permease